jgi:hypothetical protein
MKTAAPMVVPTTAATMTFRIGNSSGTDQTLVNSTSWLTDIAHFVVSGYNLGAATYVNLTGAVTNNSTPYSFRFFDASWRKDRWQKQTGDISFRCACAVHTG